MIRFNNKGGIIVTSSDDDNEKTAPSDSVRMPKHYRLELPQNAEAIDVVRAVLGDRGFEHFCRGNVIKYVIRADKKNGLEDLEKAQVYLGWEIESRQRRADDLDHFFDGLGEIVKQED